MPNKKQFIDKKNSITFQLVHRSLKDPLAVDETAPQRVLIPVSGKQINKDVNSKKRIEEQHKYGIFFDDDYDYLQHLRDVNKFTTELEIAKSNCKDKTQESSKISLPSSVFQSTFEEEVGFLNKRTPELGIQIQSYDPDIIAALDDDFDFGDPNNLLEDNFIELANKEEYVRNIGEATYDDSYDDKSNDNNYKNDKFKEETKSRFTSYSMSSSIIKRNKQLTFLDDKFEKMYADYDEEEIGALESDNVEGHLDNDSNEILRFVEKNNLSKYQDIDNISDLIKERVKISSLQQSSNEYDKNISYEEVTVENENNQWDCESVLSTYSNVYHHPQLINDLPPKNSSIKINSKTGLPQNILFGCNNNRLTSENLIRLETECSLIENNQPCVSNNSSKSVMSALTYRPKNETLEEKKERKKTIKNYRKERRKERKDNKNAFKDEKKRQEKIFNSVHQNIQGNRIF